MRLGVVLILEKERRNFAVEDMGAHEHEDDDDDYVSGTARARAAGIVGGWAEGGSADSFLVWKSERFLFPPKREREDIKWQFERGRRPP